MKTKWGHYTSHTLQFCKILPMDRYISLDRAALYVHSCVCVPTSNLARHIYVQSEYKNTFHNTKSTKYTLGAKYHTYRYTAKPSPAMLRVYSEEYIPVHLYSRKHVCPEHIS